MLLLLGCSPVTVGSGSDDSAAAPPDTGAALAQVAANPHPDPEPGPDETAALFGLDMVHTLEITLPQASIDGLNASPYDWVVADITFDGEVVEDVGVRLGGKYGSFRYLSQKAGFKIDIDRFEPDQDFHGLKRMVAKNLVQDPSFVHERVAFTVYEAMGIAAPRVGYLWVTVNGQDYGLYAHMEAVDDVFLSRAYADKDGNLYDGDYWLAPDWSYYTLIDFNQGTQSLFHLDEWEDKDLEDVEAVTAALDAAEGASDWIAQVSKVADLEHHVRYWASETWAGQYDGYSNYTNNYRVYFDPADGLVRLHPWDHDWAFYDSTPIQPYYGRLSTGCWANAECQAKMVAALQELCATVPGLELDDVIDEATALINPYIEADPRKEVGVSDVLYYQNHTRRWADQRCATLGSQLGF